MQVLSCVGLASQAPLTRAKSDAAPLREAQPLVTTNTTLTALWKAVGCRSTWITDKTRIAVAQRAQQDAIAKHPPPGSRKDRPEAAAERNDFDGWTRVRDEHSHDLSAWA